MGCIRDLRKDGAGHMARIGAPIVWRCDLIMRAPNELGGDSDATQAGQQFRIVHERRPAIARQPLSRTHATGQLVVGDLFHIRLKDGWINIGASAKLCVRQAEQIGDVAREAIAYLDAKRIDERDRRKSGAGLDRHLGCDPSAKGRADKHKLRELHAVDQVEIKISEIIDMIPPSIRRSRPKAWRDGNYDATIARQSLNECAFIRKPEPCGKIEDIASLPINLCNCRRSANIKCNRFLTHRPAPFCGRSLIQPFLRSYDHSFFVRAVNWK